MSIKFGTDGWRAIIADDFTFDNVKKVILAISKYIKDKNILNPSIVIGYDTRFLSEKFAYFSSEILAQQGIYVYLSNRDIPTPVTAYSVLVKKTDGAIMFTASHNPPEYAGLKFIPDYAGPALPDITDEIEKNISLVRSQNLDVKSQKSANVKIFDPKTEYFKKIKSIVDFSAIKSAKLKIVYDPMYGTGRDYLDEILKPYCKKIEVIHNTRNPLFGGRLPDPSRENLKELSKKVISEKFNLGLATDGDADRFGIVDNLSRYYTPNQIITLLLYHLLKNRKYKGVVARTVATTSAIDRLSYKFGIETIETPVGFKYIGEVMRKKDTIIGGEESGGLSILGHIPEKDGILACLLVAEMVAIEKKNIWDIYLDIQKLIGTSITKRIDIHLTEEKKMQVLKRLKETPLLEIANFKVIKTVNIDGFKYILSDQSSLLIRPSGTEPLIRVYIETNSSKKIKLLEDNIRKIIDRR